MFENLFSRRGLSLERLHSFLRVAEAGGISRAAAGDPVRQSQFSRQIGELEEFFAVRLTRRAGRGVELTSEGRRLAALAQAQFRELDGFRSESGGVPDEIVIGAGDSLVTWLVIPRLPEFAREFSGVAVKVRNLRSWDIVDQLAHGQLDFGLARAGLVVPPVRSVSLGRVRFALFVPSALAAKHRHLSPRELLARLPVAALGSDGEHFERVRAAGGSGGRPANIQLVTDSFPQAARAVASGHFAAVLPIHAAADLAPAGVEVVELAFLRNATRAVALAWNPRAVRAMPGGDRIQSALARLLALGRHAP